MLRPFFDLIDTVTKVCVASDECVSMVVNGEMRIIWVIDMTYFDLYYL